MKGRDTDAIMEDARKAFENHVIMREGDGKWLCRAPNTSTYWFEVVVLAGGRLLFHGDTAPVIWSRCYPHPHLTKEQNDIATVRWMASRSRPDDAYFVEKAGIGSETQDLIWQPDDDALREEIQALINEERESLAEGGFGTEENIEALILLKEQVESDNHDEIKREIYDLLGDSERIPNGRRISAGMIYAHAGLQKLMSLLDGRYALDARTGEERGRG